MSEDEIRAAVSGREFVSPDDSVFCGLCGKETSLAMIATHLEVDHGIEGAGAAIADADVVDATGDASS